MAIDDMEKKLRPPEITLKPYPPKMIKLASGEIMVVREAKREEVGALLGTVHPLIGVPSDYYDIVAVRMYSEILGWYRYRVANEFVLVGTINGVEPAHHDHQARSARRCSAVCRQNGTPHRHSR